nr:MAG TPA: hypothetical protein [Caudoviricetes sp.]
MRYLKHELANIEDEIDTIDYRMKNISNNTTRNDTVSSRNNTVFKTGERWNNLIQEKETLLSREIFLIKEITRVNKILDSLSPMTKDVAIDLLIRKTSLIKIRDKYYISNPYQCLNDELKYLEIDKF